MRTLLKSRVGNLDGIIGHRGARILKTGGWALTAKVCAAINLFVCVPFVLDALGPRHFGAWAALISVITLGGALDFGLGNGAMNLVASAKGRGADTEIPSIVSTAYSSILKTTALLATSLILMPFITWHKLLGLPVEDAGASTFAGMIVLCSILITIPLSLANKIQLGLGIGGRAFRWQAISQLLTAAIVILMANAGAGFSALVAASAMVPILGLAANTFDLRSLQIKSDRTQDRDSVIAKKIQTEGILFFILQVSAIIAFNLDLLLITSMSGAEQAANYSIVQRAFSLIPLSLGLMWISLWPTYREALAAGHYSWVYNTFRKSTLSAFLYALTAGVVIMATFEPISRFWIGHQMPISGTLIFSFASWHIAEAVGTSVAMLLNASSIIRIQVVFVVSFALSCLALKAALAAHGMMEYMPMAATITYLALNIFPIFLLRKKIVLLISGKVH